MVGPDDADRAPAAVEQVVVGISWRGRRADHELVEPLLIVELGKQAGELANQSGLARSGGADHQGVVATTDSDRERRLEVGEPAQLITPGPGTAVLGLAHPAGQRPGSGLGDLRGEGVGQVSEMSDFDRCGRINGERHWGELHRRFEHTVGVELLENGHVAGNGSDRTVQAELTERGDRLIGVGMELAGGGEQPDRDRQVQHR